MDFQYVFDPDKNAKLKRERSISFEDVIVAIEQGHLRDVRPHHNPEKYAAQDILVVEIHRYIYLVPCMQEGDSLILKTVHPSRKATAFYLDQPEQCHDA